MKDEVKELKDGMMKEEPKISRKEKVNKETEKVSVGFRCIS